MTRILALVLVAMVVFALPAQAESCRLVDGHNLCIVSLQRSAKHYWEYWAAVSLDGGRPSKVIFNCRDRIQTKTDGTTAAFGPDGLGNFVCRLYRR